MKNNKTIYEESTQQYTAMLEEAWKRDKTRLFGYLDNHYKIIRENFSTKKVNELKMLDIGCGIGFGLLYFQKKGFKNLIGIEVNEHSLLIAKKNCPQAKIIKGDIYNLPFTDNEMDLVVMMEVIEHIDDANKAFDEVVRVLKPGGVLFLTTPNRMGLMGLSNGPLKFFVQGFWYKSFLRLLGLITCGPEHPKEYFAFEIGNLLKKRQFTKVIFPFYSYIPLFPAGKFYLIAKKRR